MMFWALSYYKSAFFEAGFPCLFQYAAPVTLKRVAFFVCFEYNFGPKLMPLYLFQTPPQTYWQKGMIILEGNLHFLLLKWLDP